MKERPILFNGPMVRAILEGRKTQTRRVVRPSKRWPQYTICKPDGMTDAHSVWWHGPEYDRVGVSMDCPFGQPGDRLWVRETWAGSGNEDGHPIDADGNLVEMRDAQIFYRADTTPGPYGCDLLPDGSHYFDSWRPSIHMPRWASRILLEVVSVRVERLQEISYDDAEAEGIEQRWTCLNPGTGSYAHANDVHDDFRSLWGSIATPGATWADNPWVWAVEFKAVEANNG